MVKLKEVKGFDGVLKVYKKNKLDEVRKKVKEFINSELRDRNEASKLLDEIKELYNLFPKPEQQEIIFYKLEMPVRSLFENFVKVGEKLIH